MFSPPTLTRPLVAVAIALCAFTPAANADQLQDLLQRKELRCGTLADIPPFATPLADMERDGEINEIWNKWLGPNTGYKIARKERVTPIAELKFNPAP